MSWLILLKVGLTLVVPGILIAIGSTQGREGSVPWTAGATLVMLVGTGASVWVESRS